MLLLMGWRMVGVAVGAVVLAGSIVLLRGQVPPPVPPPAIAQPEPEADRGLPVREPVRPPNWRVFGAEPGSIEAVSDRGYVVSARPNGDQLRFTVRRRDTLAAVQAYAVPAGGVPWASALHRGRLVVAAGQPVRLTAVDLLSGQVTELPAPAGYSFRPRLLELGDEVLVLGWQERPSSSCVLAVRPDTGAVRVPWCAARDRIPAWLYAGIDEVSWPASNDPPAGCLRWHRLHLGGEVQTVAVDPALCGARGLVQLDGWQVGLRTDGGTGTDPPLIVASDGGRQLDLGTARSVLPCGRRLYWAGADGTVYRWVPGEDHRELVYRVDSARRQSLAAPRCSGGVLSVAVTTAGSDPTVIELRALTRP